MTTVFVLAAEHPRHAGRVLKTYATLAGAEEEGMNLTNIMLKDCGRAQSANASNWRSKLEELQDEHGAQFCYIDIDEQEILCPAPVCPHHSASVSDQLRLIGQLAGTTDKRGHQDQRDIAVYIDSVTSKMLASLKLAEPVCEDAYHDAVALEQEPSEYARERAQSTAAALAAWDAVKDAIAAAEGRQA